MAICSNCGTVTEGDFCPECGMRVTPAYAPDAATVAMDQQPAGAYTQPFERPANAYAQPAPQYQPPANNYCAPVKRELTAEELPEKYRPLSGWAYFGYTLLFGLPIAGLILLIVFSFNDSNINRRNYARSFWCALLVAASIFLVFLMIALVLRTSIGGLFNWLK